MSVQIKCNSKILLAMDPWATAMDPWATAFTDYDIYHKLLFHPANLLDCPDSYRSKLALSDLQNSLACVCRFVEKQDLPVTEPLGYSLLRL
jgi:hypothetical protein